MSLSVEEGRAVRDVFLTFIVILERYLDVVMVRLSLFSSLDYPLLFTIKGQRQHFASTTYNGLSFATILLHCIICHFTSLWLCACAQTI